MRIGSASEQLLSRAAFGAGRSPFSPPSGQGVAALAGRFAALRSGAPAGDAPTFQPSFRFESRFRDVDRFETRVVTETRDVTREEAIEEVRDVYAARDVLEERTRYVSRDIVETRDVFEDRDIREARVQGTKSLSSANSTIGAGISSGSGFSIATADGGEVQVRFDGIDKLSVSVGGTTTEIGFNAIDGSFKKALVDGLNGSGTVSASWTADGKLALSDGSDMTIRALGGNSALNALGLSAGKTKAEVVGTERVKIGTEQVVVGTEMVADGVEAVVVGTERYVAGTETVVVGTRQVKIGEEQVVTGTERVKVGTERVADGVERKLAGLERMNAPPSFWRADGAPRKLPVSVVDVIADVVKFRDSLFSEAEFRSAYGFAAGLKEEDAPKLVGTLRNEAERPQRPDADTRD